jgi:putative CocE/NonD family hydrolase
LVSRSIFVFCLNLAASAPTQELDFPEGAIGDPAALAKAMPGLAKQVLAVYREDDRDRYLDKRFRLEMVAGQYPEALKSLASLGELRRPVDPARSAWFNVQYEIYARARAAESADKLPFDEAYQRFFRETLRSMDDRTSARLIRAAGSPDLEPMRRDVQQDLEQQEGKRAISLVSALKLIRDYQVDEAYRSFKPLLPPMIAEEDLRRYVIDKDIQVKTPDGATVCTLVVRPRASSGRLPALLEFTIYADARGNLGSSRRAASSGYAGVVGLTRGKGCSPDKPVPYEHDGADAAALIDWISAQPWSDGRVGMNGGSYSGGTAWAAAKHRPKALKAIVVGAPVAPGIDVPMEGNVFWNFVYPWPFFTTNVKGLDEATYSQTERWARLNHDWYMSGRPYRELDQIDGTPNPVFHRWIDHPSYDAYWRNMIPFGKEFAQVNLPVLTTAGYYFGGPGAAVYYMTQHYKNNPRADHTLLIGPYDHFGGQRGTPDIVGEHVDTLSGYKLDPVALIDILEIRDQWFDHLFKGAARPPVIKDKVNYQVTGANVWKHAPSLAAMANQKMRLHLSAVRSGSAYKLSTQKPSRGAFVPQTVNLADRSDADRVTPGGGVLDKVVDTWNGHEFVSDPLPKATELSGLFSGQLDFITNKKDFDFQVALYEQTPKGEYFQLAPYWARASYVGDFSHRRLLTPGKRQRLRFTSIRLMSHQLQQGSRLVVVLSVIKEPERQINYGTGRDVSDESIKDATAPLEIKWYSESYIEVPISGPKALARE